MKVKELYGKQGTLNRIWLYRKIVFIKSIHDSFKRMKGKAFILEKLRDEYNRLVTEYNEISDTKLKKIHVRKLRIEV